MSLCILNDTHIGVERSAGTTVLTKAKLKAHVLEQFEALLPDGNSDLMILGDLYDRHEVDISDAIGAIQVLKVWLDSGIGTLYLVAGNHDLSKTSGVASSLDLTAVMLQFIADRSSRIVLIKEPTMTPHGYVIPHLPNQEAFNAALAEVPECRYLFLHVNYDNKFAAQSDQSLNITKEQVEACKVELIICGHEHQTKAAPKILLPGNQIATSVSDWQGCNGKCKVEIDDGKFSLVPVVLKDTEYTEQHWTDPKVTNHKFVRIVGEATAEQSAMVVNAVAKFRSISPALVVANAVQIASESGVEGFGDSLESVRAFDVWAALGEVLEASEITTLQGLE